jgi:hypothetical protein
MPNPYQTRIMQSGTSWYWELVINDRDVVASGIAETHAQARADADEAFRRTPADTRCGSLSDHGFSAASVADSLCARL